jgi:hypothetical protein
MGAWRRPASGTYPLGMSLIALVLLVAAVALVVATEWPRLAERGLGGRRRPGRGGKTLRRKQHLRVVRDEPDDDFARSVERDLAALPTIDERDRKKS